MQELGASRRASPWIGALWKVTACACFAGINGAVRLLSGGSSGGSGIPTHELAFFQNLFGLMFVLPWFLQDRRLLVTQQSKVYLLRALISVTGVVLWYTALKYMEIAQAVALNFTGPIFTILWASLFLGESISRSRWLAITLGFVGAFVAGRPDIILQQWEGGFLQWVALIPMLSAAMISGSYILSKRLMIKDSPKTVTIYLLLLMTPLSFLPCLIAWETPQLWQWPLLLGMGLLSAGANFSLNKALASADVTFLIPFGLSRLFFSATIGYLLFNEIPSNRTWIGTLVIIVAILSLDYSTAAHKSPTPLKSTVPH